MIAASVGYDLVFLVHILAAVATVTVLVAMRASASQVAAGADEQVQRARIPQGRNWAARVMHLLAVTGLTMTLVGSSDVSLTRPWIIVGLLCYLAAAGHLEARTLPLERVVAEVIGHEGVAAPERGRALVRSIDTVLALVGVALLAMLVQF
jgi:uncharacterized membrane protein